MEPRRYWRKWEWGRGLAEQFRASQLQGNPRSFAFRSGFRLRAQTPAKRLKLQGKLLSPRINTDYVRRGQVTSRSGVLKRARSRVVIGENANGEGGLAGAFSTHGTPGQAQHSAKDAVWVTLSRRAMDLFPHALDARVGHPALPSGAYFSRFSKTSEGLSSPRISGMRFQAVLSVQ